MIFPEVHKKKSANILKADAGQHSQTSLWECFFMGFISVLSGWDHHHLLWTKSLMVWENMKRAEVAVVRMICRLSRVYTFLRKSKGRGQRRRDSITEAGPSPGHFLRPPACFWDVAAGWLWSRDSPSGVCEPGWASVVWVLSWDQCQQLGNVNTK